MRDVVLDGGDLLGEDKLTDGPALRLDSMSLQRRNLFLFDLEL